jgi:hypothetical protein
MRSLVLYLVFLSFGDEVVAQSPSRDWRPADRTVIGDFTWVTSIAAALDRVFVTSPAQVLIWRWSIRWTTRSGWPGRTGGSTFSRSCRSGIGAMFPME